MWKLDKMFTPFWGDSILLQKPSMDIKPMLSVSSSVVPDSLWPLGLQPTRLLCPWDFAGKDTGVGCHFLLHGILPAQGSNLGLLHCRRILYQLSYKGSHLLTMWITTNCEKFFERWKYQITSPVSWKTCMQIKKQQLEPNMEQKTGFKLGKG